MTFSVDWVAYKSNPQRMLLNMSASSSAAFSAATLCVGNRTFAIAARGANTAHNMELVVSGSAPMVNNRSPQLVGIVRSPATCSSLTAPDPYGPARPASEYIETTLFSQSLTAGSGQYAGGAAIGFCGSAFAHCHRNGFVSGVVSSLESTGFGSLNAYPTFATWDGPRQLVRLLTKGGALHISVGDSRTGPSQALDTGPPTHGRNRNGIHRINPPAVSYVITIDPPAGSTAVINLDQYARVASDGGHAITTSFAFVNNLQYAVTIKERRWKPATNPSSLWNSEMTVGNSGQERGRKSTYGSFTNETFTVNTVSNPGSINGTYTVRSLTYRTNQRLFALKIWKNGASTRLPFGPGWVVRLEDVNDRRHACEVELAAHSWDGANSQYSGTFPSWTGISGRMATLMTNGAKLRADIRVDYQPSIDNTGCSGAPPPPATSGNYIPPNPPPPPIETGNGDASGEPAPEPGASGDSSPRRAEAQSNQPAGPTEVTSCFTDLGSLASTSEAVEYAGSWDDASCKAHHQSSRARYFQFTVAAETTVAVDLSAGNLYVSRDTPKNGWGKVPGPGYEHRVNVRRNNGKLVHDGANTPTLTLAAGSYTVEAAGASGDFTITLTPQ